MEKLENKLIFGAQLVGAGGTTWLTYIKDFSGAATFIIMFLIGATIQILKFRQEFRHNEEEHSIKMNILKHQDEQQNEN